MMATGLLVVIFWIGIGIAELLDLAGGLYLLPSALLVGSFAMLVVVMNVVDGLRSKRHRREATSSRQESENGANEKV